MNGSSIRFSEPWRGLAAPDGTLVYRPVLPVSVRAPEGAIDRLFLVDSGADISMAPFALFRRLGRKWRDGERSLVRGIARRRDCQLSGGVHEIDLLIPAAGILMRVPIVFVRGDAPYVLGRDVLFEAFSIAFDPVRRRTVFELIDR